MRKFLFTLLLSTGAHNALAQDATIYRWVDSNNIVHFSHEHPTDKDYAQVDVKVSYKPIPKTAEEKAVEEQDEETAKNAAQAIADNCKLAKENLKTLNENEQIMLKDLEGNARLLSNEEKKIQIELSEKQVEVYCEAARFN